MENASDDFPQQKKLENLLPNFAESSPPISLKTSPTSLWKSLVLRVYSVVSRSRRTKTRECLDLRKVGKQHPTGELSSAMETTMRPEMITQITRKQLFCVTDVCVILGN